VAARRIDGVAEARSLRESLRPRVEALAARGTVPGLAVLLVGDDPASAVYVRNKVRACEEVGIRSVLERHPASIGQAALLARVAALNADPAIHGILVQLPLPAGLDAQAAIAAIDPAKDVDGYSVESAGALVAGQPGLRPCTPAGCMRLIASTGVAPRGRHAVVVGRSRTVGTPMALLLLAADATVTVCHSRTDDLAARVREGDIVVAAAGRPGLVTGAMLKPGAVVIDVGIHRRADGTLCGDVDFASAEAVAGWITPVPGGVGPMTVAMLLANTVEAAETRHPSAPTGAP
jgi:methylenetetrahydrofolate dehydrogenase (NADP+)/methenyltetrahydrofolate cyclohydrolase